MGGDKAMNPIGKMKYFEADKYAAQLTQKITAKELLDIFPMPHTSALAILKRHGKHRTVNRKNNPPSPKCEIALDRSINYNDSTRRAATRERIRRNNGVQS